MSADTSQRDACAGMAIVYPKVGDTVFVIDDGKIVSATLDRVMREDILLEVSWKISGGWQGGGSEAGLQFFDDGTDLDEQWWNYVFLNRGAAERVLASEQKKRAAGYDEGPINGISKP